MKKRSFSLFTAKRLKSNKIFLLLSLAILTAVDVFIIATLGLQKYPGVYFICPIIMLVLDVLFCVNAIFSNFRFKYTIRDVLIYVLGIAVNLVAVGLTLMGVLGMYVMTGTAGVLWIITHAVACIAMVFGMIFAANVKWKGKTVTAVIATVAFVAIAGGYSGFLWQDGYFGQGNDNRIITYSYDDDTESYVAEDILMGLGDTVKIPTEFNGKPVSAVNCEIFNEDIKTVFIEGQVKFANLSDLTSPNAGLKIVANKETVDGYREYFHGMAGSMNNGSIVHSFGNLFSPDVKEEEVFVTFGYDRQSYEMAEGKILPTWYGRKGEQFTLAKYCLENPEYEYLLHNDVSDEEDIYWNYSHGRRPIASEPIYGEESIDGAVLNESVSGAKITFEEVFRIKIEGDNDGLYEIPDEDRYLDPTANKYRYVTLDNAQDLVDNMPVREGFSLKWKYSSGSDYRYDMSSLSDVLSANGDLTLHPVWELNLPIFSLKGDKEGNSSVYGEDVTFTATLLDPIDSLDYRYEWYDKGVLDGTVTAGEYNLVDPLPGIDDGNYGLTVTVYSDTVTTLTAEYTVTLPWVVNRKELSFDWSMVEGTERDGVISVTYNGTDQNVTATVDSEDIVGEDVVEYYLDIPSVRDVTDYYISTVYLQEGTVEKYIVKGTDAERKIIVTPCPLTLTYENTEVTYNGEYQHPQVTAIGVGSDGKLEVTSNEVYKNQGSYTYVPRIQNTNYKITNPSTEFVIKKKLLTPLSWTTTTIIYNGSEQKPTIATYDGLIDADIYVIADFVEYLDCGKNAGTHTVKATLKENANYYFDGGAVSREYSIEKRGLTVYWNTTSFTYNGVSQGPTVSSFVNQVSGDDFGIWLDLNYSEGYVDAGNYQRTVTMDSDSNYYVKENATINYTIGKKDLTVTPRVYGASIFEKNEKTYDGKPFSDDDYSYTLVGKVLLDIDDKDIFEIEYTGSVVNTVAAGTYTLSGEITEGVKGKNYAITVVPVTVNIKKKSIKVIFDDVEKTYDGVGTSDFSAKCDQLAEGDTLAEVFAPTFSSSLTSATAVGVYDIDKVGLNATAKSNNYAITTEKGTLTIKKKSLTVNWSADRTFVYDGQAHSVTYGVGGFVGTENEVTAGITVSGGEGVNAGSNYAMRLNLPTVTNYAFVSGNEVCSYVIEKRDFTVTYQDYQKIYDGSGYNYSYVCSGGIVGVPDDTVFQPIYNVTYKDVGTYVMTCDGYRSLTATANYNIIVVPAELKINHRQITLSWSATRSFLYDGTEKKVYYTVNNAVPGETVGETVSGGQVNVGSGYVTTVTLPVVSNYVISGMSSCEYSITPRNITVKFNTLSGYYKGSAYGTSAYSYVITRDGIASTDGQNEVFSLSYTGDAMTAVDAGEYSVNATVAVEGAKYDNYSIAFSPATFTILPKELDIVWSGNNFLYDGTVKKPTYEVNTVMGNDNLSDILTVSIPDSIATGKYTATATLKSGVTNYTIRSGGSYDYSITNVVTLSWATDQTEFHYTDAVPYPTAVCSVSGVTLKYEFKKDNLDSWSTTVPTSISTAYHRVRVSIVSDYYYADPIETLYRVKAFV